MKTERIAAIDILRCIAIIGMVLSANIGFYSDLPAWMFHAQTPPPDYAFDPTSVGLTWVDLVFPFFLFPMGAAFPLAMRKRVERGESTASMVLSLFRRWVVLILFALVLGNAYSVAASHAPQWQHSLFKVFMWASLFLALLHPGKPSKSAKSSGLSKLSNESRTYILNGTGLCLLIAGLAIQYFIFGIPLTTSNDIIITILANVAFFGGLIWLLTKDSLRLRWLIFLFVAAIKACDSYIPEFSAAIDAIPECGWLFSIDYLQYLLIAIPGSVVGDKILSYIKPSNSAGSVHPLHECGSLSQPSDEYSEEVRAVNNSISAVDNLVNQSNSESTASDMEIGKSRPLMIVASFVALAAVVLQLWGLYTRNVAADFGISFALASAFVLLTFRNRSLWSDVAVIGFALMLAGIVFDPIDGGITKDYCNLSYLLTTGGMAMIVTSSLLCWEMVAGVKSRFLSSVGQNPMVAYTIAYFLIGPVLTLTGLMPLIDSLSAGSPFWGLFKGLIITLLMMVGTALCTRLKLFWRS